MNIPIISGIIDLIGKAVDKAVPDKGQAAKLKSKLSSQLISLDIRELEAAQSIIVAEANGESWLQRNWRPIIMMFFAALIGAHWLGHTAQNLSEAEVLELLEIVKFGIGGYVLGRSGEKIMREYKK